jgi:hypothetical protein
MDSSLHMHVASLRIQDEMRRASSARLAQQARQASRACAKTTGGRWVALRAIPRSLRRAY